MTKTLPDRETFDRLRVTDRDGILFFRSGNTYKIVYENALAAHRNLGLKLEETEEGVKFVTLPADSVEGYLKRMILADYRVACIENW